MDEKQIGANVFSAIRAYRLKRMEEISGITVDEDDSGNDRQLETKYGHTAKREVVTKQEEAELRETLTDVATIAPENLPQVISQQFEKIAELENKVRKAKEVADHARERAADTAEMSAGWFHKKSAIEALQSTTEDIAAAQVELVDAMNVSFEYQQQLGQIAQYLFILGVSNIAATRTVVQRLRMELQNTPKEKMSDLARTEIMTVINQLQQQEDMANRQEKQSKTLQQHAATLKEHEKAINENLAQGQMKDDEQDRTLSQIAETDDEQDTLIAENTTKNTEQDRQIQELVQRIEALEKKVAQKTSNVPLIAAAAAAAIAVILGVLHFFI